MVTRRWQIAALAWALSGSAGAQTVQWDPPGGALAVGRTTEFDLVCRDCQLRATPQPPQIPGLVLRYIASSAGFDASGIPVTKYVFWGYWSRMEDLVIPSFVADTDHGGISVAEARFEPIPATVGRNKEPLSSAASAALTVPAEVWTGEVFPVTYTIEADANYQPDWAHAPPDWSHPGIEVEDWTAPQAHDTSSAAGRRAGLQYEARAIALVPGRLTFTPERELVNLNVGIAVFGPPTPQYEQFSVPCEPATVQARPLPPPPPGFLGGVGQFAISAHVAPQSAAPGEPVTWTIELSGTGNWPQIKSLPPRAVPAGFRVVHPQLQRSPDPGKVFDGRVTEDLVLVPSKPGHYVLPAVSWVYFDPARGAYRTVASEPAPLDISGTAPADLAAPPGGEGLRLPPDPLPLGDRRAGPLPAAVRVAAGIAPFFLVAAGWLALALGRARETDPGRARREAWARQRRRLLLIQEAAQANDAARLRPLLLGWQHDSVLAWDLPEPAPTPESIGDRAEGALWAEADEAIYGPQGRLPDDWLVRADQSLDETPPPPFRWERALAPRNLFPFAALLLALVPAGFGQTPAGARADYAAGRFASAEAAWRRADPADAAAKCDVSLALAQQGRWGEAASWAAAAFVRHPGQRQIRAQFLAACDRASIEPGPLGRFLAPTVWSRWVELESPAAWQRLAIAGAWLAAAGLFTLLLFGYGRLQAPAWPRAGLALLLAGLAGGFAAWLSGRAYGAAADGDAQWVAQPAVMRSIPTDVQGGQATAPLPPGSIGVPDKRFLGWTRLRFDDGSSGWVRRSDLVPLWQ